MVTSKAFELVLLKATSVFVAVLLYERSIATHLVAAPGSDILIPVCEILGALPVLLPIQEDAFVIASSLVKILTWACHFVLNPVTFVSVAAGPGHPTRALFLISAEISEVLFAVRIKVGA